MNKKEHVVRKINTKLIKRKSTYTKDGKKEIKIKDKIEIAPLFIKRNKSLNLETFKDMIALLPSTPAQNNKTATKNSVNKR